MSRSRQNCLVRANLNLYIITFVWSNYRSFLASLWPVLCRVVLPSARKCCCRLPRIIVVLLLGYQQIGKCKQPKSRLPFFYLRSFGFTTICLSSANREENDELKSSEVFFYNSNVGNVICQELMSSPFLDESASVSNPNR